MKGHRPQLFPLTASQIRVGLQEVDLAAPPWILRSGKTDQRLAKLKRDVPVAKAKAIPQVCRLAVHNTRHEGFDPTLQPRPLLGKEAQPGLAAQRETEWEDRANVICVAVLFVSQGLSRSVRAELTNRAQ